jgi:hypothetical protein
MVTTAALLEFCEQHPELPAAARARQRLTRGKAPPPALIFDQDDAGLRAALADMKAAVDATLEALEHSAHQARDVAEAHSRPPRRSQGLSPRCTHCLCLRLRHDLGDSRAPPAHQHRPLKTQGNIRSTRPSQRQHHQTSSGPIPGSTALRPRQELMASYGYSPGWWPDHDGTMSNSRSQPRNRRTAS